jgi:hypothetical protein
MCEFLRRLLWDESAFERYARLVLIGVGTYINANTVTGYLPQWCYDHISIPTLVTIGSALTGLGALIGAGDKNETK